MAQYCTGMNICSFAMFLLLLFSLFYILCLVFDFIILVFAFRTFRPSPYSLGYIHDNQHAICLFRKSDEITLGKRNACIKAIKRSQSPLLLILEENISPVSVAKLWV